MTDENRESKNIDKFGRKEYLAKYTIYYAESELQKKAGIKEYIWNKEKFYDSWFLKYEHSRKILAKDDEFAKEESETVREYLVHLLEHVRVIDVTVDELLEIRNVNIDHIKRRSLDKVISGKTNYRVIGN